MSKKPSSLKCTCDYFGFQDVLKLDYTQLQFQEIFRRIIPRPLLEQSWEKEKRRKRNGKESEKSKANFGIKSYKKNETS
jgi:hypothetical protein